MSAKAKLENLQQVKQNLCDKYTRLAKIAGSKPKRQRFQNKAAEYSIQAQRAAIKLSKRS